MIMQRVGLVKGELRGRVRESISDFNKQLWRLGYADARIKKGVNWWYNRAGKSNCSGISCCTKLLKE